MVHEELAVKLKALADPVRIQILDFLLDPIQSCCAQDDGVCACDFESFLGLSQPTISHHMKILVQAGFVTGEKRGRWVYYDLDSQAFAELSHHLGRYQKIKAC
jgi:ArsR family transcriptional regulator